MLEKIRLKDRLHAVIPKKEEMIPFLSSFAIALLAKVPLTAYNTAGTLIILEQLKDHPDLVPLGLTAYGIFTILSAALDYKVMKKRRASASAKANTLYRGFTFLLPGRHGLNTALAEISTAAMTVVGINPDPTAAASTFLSLTTGNWNIWLSQRLSDSAMSLVTQVPANLAFLGLKLPTNSR